MRIVPYGINPYDPNVEWVTLPPMTMDEIQKELSKNPDYNLNLNSGSSNNLSDKSIYKLSEAYDYISKDLKKGGVLYTEDLKVFNEYCKNSPVLFKKLWDVQLEISHPFLSSEKLEVLCDQLVLVWDRIVARSKGIAGNKSVKAKVADSFEKKVESDDPFASDEEVLPRVEVKTVSVDTLFDDPFV